MGRRIYFSMTATFAFSAALVGLPAHAGSATTGATTGITTASTTSAACNPKFAPYGLIGDRWRASGGENSAYGCPTRAEYGFTTNKARRQDFENGQIGWSPTLGPKAMIRAYRTRGKANFQWGPTGRDWDYFEVRYAFNNGPVKKYKVKRRDAWNGAFSMHPGGPGPDPLGCSHSDGSPCGFAHYFSVRGCDNTGVFQAGSECGGWSIPGRL
ncbi:hypothetical protein FE391_44445 [Nonomuraea sp. KC401]|uniref:LGFP repeat-containing protein n=1 Tax=unclassified Nonomuraea TaxID=2593643 RepID=UPI0010FDAF23|nr:MULTISPECIES: hypothetical protein [unclassified Nonomuraea]NBF00335.1 hypothetical protein [Nonomuraea sp. K271]TLF51669.1 hypothetical protein FE391_44445 [Nonomuraea sp. KC401]